MILKSFNLKTNELDKFNNFLLYGENEGHKEEILKIIIDKKKNIFKYDEKDILRDKNKFYDSISTQSFFESSKVIIINNSSEKLLEVLEVVTDRNYSDIKLVVISGILEKKSKLRNYFEKNEDVACIAFYQDNPQNLLSIANFFFREKKIKVSQEILNKIVNKANGDRKNLKNELEKIQSYSLNKKQITSEVIDKLTNMNENNNVSELIDNCLAKNDKKLNFLINENNFIFEDTILIIRTFLIKAKRLLKLKKELELNKNIEETILKSKPPIFWKDKELVKLQLKNWSVNQIEQLIIDINNTELLIKKIHKKLLLFCLILCSLIQKLIIRFNYFD